MEETLPIHLGTADKAQEVGRVRLIPEEPNNLFTLWKKYKNVFALSYDDIPGVSIDIVQHKVIF